MKRSNEAVVFGCVLFLSVPTLVYTNWWDNLLSRKQTNKPDARGSITLRCRMTCPKGGSICYEQVRSFAQLSDEQRDQCVRDQLHSPEKPVSEACQSMNFAMLIVRAQAEAMKSSFSGTPQVRVINFKDGVDYTETTAMLDYSIATRLSSK